MSNTRMTFSQLLSMADSVEDMTGKRTKVRENGSGGYTISLGERDFEVTQANFRMAGAVLVLETAQAVWADAFAAGMAAASGE